MRLRSLTAALALSAALTAAAAGRVEAQGVRTFNGPGGPTVLTPGAAVARYTYVANPVSYSSGYSAGVSGYVPPYSYYAAIPPAPARVYVGYGDTGFPFYGRPYGKPNDRWSWENMGNVNGSLLSRYYYPPVR